MLPIVYLEVPSYALWATLGFIVSLLFTLYRSYSIELPFRHFLLYIGVCAVLLVVFARIMFVLGMIPQHGDDPELLFGYLLNGGIVFYGGLFGLLLGIIIVSRILKRNAMDMLDFFAPGIPLFHIFGRIGCLFAGCCYGKEWSWGIILTEDPNTIRFPVQFFESLCNLVIFIFIMLRIKKRGNYRGSLYVYLVAYSLIRFVLEFYRGDIDRGIWIGLLSTAQLVSLAILVAVVIQVFLKEGKKREKKESAL